MPEGRPFPILLAPQQEGSDGRTLVIEAVSRETHRRADAARRGALGAYHIGAYQALAEHNLHPDWVAGISIGAINCAIIAGNRPEDRVKRLTALWEAISRPELPAKLAFHGVAGMAQHSQQY